MCFGVVEQDDRSSGGEEIARAGILRQSVRRRLGPVEDDHVVALRIFRAAAGCHRVLLSQLLEDCAVR
jgi:hypothetical protein